MLVGLTSLHFRSEAMHRLYILSLVVLLVFYVSCVMPGDVVETLVVRIRSVVTRLCMAQEILLLFVPVLLKHQSININRYRLSLFLFNLNLQIHHGDFFAFCHC
jgi:hypothetical protein